MKSRDDVIELTEDQFRKFLLELQSCEEAIRVFEDMYICPCCGAMVDNNGELHHKPKVLVIN